MRRSRRLSAHPCLTKRNEVVRSAHLARLSTLGGDDVRLSAADARPMGAQRRLARAWMSWLLHQSSGWANGVGTSARPPSKPQELFFLRSFQLPSDRSRENHPASLEREAGVLRLRNVYRRYRALGGFGSSKRCLYRDRWMMAMPTTIAVRLRIAKITRSGCRTRHPPFSWISVRIRSGEDVTVAGRRGG